MISTRQLLFALAISHVLYGCAIEFLDKDLVSKTENITLSMGAMSVSAGSNFGAVAVGSSSSITLTITNTGGTPVTSLMIGYFPPDTTRDSSVAGNCGTTLAAGDSCNMKFVYAPLAAGAMSGNLNLLCLDQDGTVPSFYRMFTGSGY